MCDNVNFTLNVITIFRGVKNNVIKILKMLFKFYIFQMYFYF